MRADRIGHRPKPRARTLTLDAGFFVGIGLVAALAWWVRGDVPPGLAGEPDLTPFQGTPLLVVYGAPGCVECERQWRTLEPTLPEGLRVLHLAARAAIDDPRPANEETVRQWAATLGASAGDVLPAHLPQRALPAVVLRSERGRWRFERGGSLGEDGMADLRRAFAREGLADGSRLEEPAAP